MKYQNVGLLYKVLIGNIILGELFILVVSISGWRGFEPTYINSCAWMSWEYLFPLEVFYFKHACLEFPTSWVKWTLFLIHGPVGKLRGVLWLSTFIWDVEGGVTRTGAVGLNTRIPTRGSVQPTSVSWCVCNIQPSVNNKCPGFFRISQENHTHENPTKHRQSERT